MILKIYTIFDRKAVAHHQPFYARSDAEAMRMIMESMHGGQSKLSQWPDDYHLYGLGKFDDQTGEIVGCDHPEPVASVKELADQLRRDLLAQSTAQLDMEDFARNHRNEEAAQ